MKRFLIIMGIVALVFSSCSKDTIKEVRKGKEISFVASIDNETRATEFTNYNLDCFYATAVSGVPEDNIELLNAIPEFFFKDVPFTRIGDYFYSYPTYYWPEDNRYMWIFAYAPEIEKVGDEVIWKITKNSSDEYLLNWSIKGVRPAVKIADQVDLLSGVTLANKESIERDGSPRMSMKHILSQIEIRAKSYSSNYTYKICGVRIANPISCCDIDLWQDVWTYRDEKAVYEDTYESPVTLHSYSQYIMNPASGNAILIPQTLTAWDPDNDPTNQAKGAYFSVKLQVTDKNGRMVFPTNGEEYGWAAIPVSDRWNNNYKYVYTLDFTNGAGYVDPMAPENPGKNILGDKIAFTTNLAAWDDKVTVQASNRDLIGHWVGLKGSYIDSDDNIEHKYETAEQVEDWLGEFYDFIVPDENTLKIKNAAGEYNTPTTFNVVDNYVLMDCFRNGDGYALKPYIQHIDESSAIIVNTYVYSSYTRVQTIYYKKSPLE